MAVLHHCSRCHGDVALQDAVDDSSQSVDRGLVLRGNPGGTGHVISLRHAELQRFRRCLTRKQEASPGRGTGCLSRSSRSSVASRVAVQTASCSRSGRLRCTLQEPIRSLVSLMTSLPGLSQSELTRAGAGERVQKQGDSPAERGVPLRILQSAALPLLTAAPWGPAAELQPARSSLTNCS